MIALLHNLLSIIHIFPLHSLLSLLFFITPIESIQQHIGRIADPKTFIQLIHDCLRCGINLTMSYPTLVQACVEQVKQLSSLSLSSSSSFVTTGHANGTENENEGGYMHIEYKIDRIPIVYSHHVIYRNHSAVGVFHHCYCMVLHSS